MCELVGCGPSAVEGERDTIGSGNENTRTQPSLGLRLNVQRSALSSHTMLNAAVGSQCHCRRRDQLTPQNETTWCVATDLKVHSTAAPH